MSGLPLSMAVNLRNAAATQCAAAWRTIRFRFPLSLLGLRSLEPGLGQTLTSTWALFLNDEVKSIAYIKSQIFDQGEISGRFTRQSAEDLALTLRSGALPAKIEYQEERTVGPSLGADSIRSGVRASLFGLLFVVAFMLFYYRGSGVNAVVALTAEHDPDAGGTYRF